jgi:hypothetical protein
VGTIPVGDTATFERNNSLDKITIYGAASATDSFTINDTSIVFEPGDPFDGTTLNFSGFSDRELYAQGKTNIFSIEGTGTTGPAGNLWGDAGSNRFFFSGSSGVSGNIKGSGSTTLNYNGYSSGVTVNLVTGAATGVSGGKVSGITYVVGSPYNDTLTGNGTGVRLSGGPGTNTISGSGADAVFESGATSFTLTDSSLTGSDFTDNLSGITVADLTDTAGGNTFTVSGWAYSGTLKDSGKIADTISASKAANFTLGKTTLASSDGMSLVLSGKITTANLTVTATSGNPSYIVDASAFTGVTNLTAGGTVNAILFGGSGNGSTLTASGSGNDVLIGGRVTNTLSDTGTGYNILIGGAGVDAITGNGNDILISGTTSYDRNTSANIAALDAILAEWSSTDSYSVRISKIMSGVGPGGTDALNTTTCQSDGVANTVSDGSAPTQDNWFIVNTKDKVTKQGGETETIV